MPFLPPALVRRGKFDRRERRLHPKLRQSRRYTYEPQRSEQMPPIHLAGEMAVWSEEKWAAFEGDLQRQMRAERRRLNRLAARRQRARSFLTETAAWSFFAAALLLVLLY
jgi:hypothetical protein